MFIPLYNYIYCITTNISSVRARSLNLLIINFFDVRSWNRPTSKTNYKDNRIRNTIKTYHLFVSVNPGSNMFKGLLHASPSYCDITLYWIIISISNSHNHTTIYSRFSRLSSRLTLRSQELWSMRKSRNNLLYHHINTSLQPIISWDWNKSHSIQIILPIHIIHPKFSYCEHHT